MREIFETYIKKMAVNLPKKPFSLPDIPNLKWKSIICRYICAKIGYKPHANNFSQDLTHFQMKVLVFYHYFHFFCVKFNIYAYNINFWRGLTTFEEDLIFRQQKRPFCTPVAPKRDMMWYNILRPSLSSAHCASFMLRWSLLRGGKGSAYP